MAHKLRHQTFHCCWLALLAVLASTKAHSSTAHIPQPWRSDAVVQGRDEMYNTERFLHELTFRHRQHLPAATDNGIRGTGGSVSSRRLYFDFRYRQDFDFRAGDNGFLLDIQRGEDLDGSYQRQLVGFRKNLGDSTELWLQGDVFSDKAESDIYLSARQHLPGNSWLHASLILPDYYFNSKTDSPDRFAREDSRRHTGFTGKLALPITTRLSATEQATLTLNPTLYLHKFGFGGGNLQLHWPM